MGKIDLSANSGLQFGMKFRRSKSGFKNNIPYQSLLINCMYVYCFYIPIFTPCIYTTR